jgi:ATP-dependent protease Clp ATPase subunit
MYYCAFCGKGQNRVRKLIKGLTDVFICDECVATCVNLLRGEGSEDQAIQHAARTTHQAARAAKIQAVREAKARKLRARGEHI